MALNLSKGNMYPWVSHTWNVIKGKCPHDCSYCYMKRYPQPELHFDFSELKTSLGNGRLIFVGSSCDMWADDISVEWIELVLEHCRLYPQNEYLFQSKNPQRIIDWTCDLPPRTIIGATIESNYNLDSCKAPHVYDRMIAMGKTDLRKMISIEPIMNFELDVMIGWMQTIKPLFISIGADSGNNHLPEPGGDKVKALIKALKEFTEVKIKDNLERLL